MMRSGCEKAWRAAAHQFAEPRLGILQQPLARPISIFFTGIVGQLARAAGGEPDQRQLNFMLSVVKDIKPQNQVQAMLAAQMAAVHVAAMQSARDLAEAKCIEQRDIAERTFNKLARTFVTQMDGLKRNRTGGEQTVTVQQVNVGEGGQAIVGNVTQSQREAPPAGTTAPPLAVSHDRTAPMPIIESKAEYPVLVARFEIK